MSTAAPTSHVAPAAGALTTGLVLSLAGAVPFSAKAILVKPPYRYGLDAVTLIALRKALAAPCFALAPWLASRSAQRLAGVLVVSRKGAAGGRRAPADRSSRKRR